jgi:hypothetical protein
VAPANFTWLAGVEVGKVKSRNPLLAGVKVIFISLPMTVNATPLRSVEITLGAEIEIFEGE